MKKSGRAIAEKSMERTKFYNREDLKAKDVVRLIGIWEGEAGDGTYEYIAQFYNGGTYLDEVLEDGIKNTLK